MDHRKLIGLAVLAGALGLGLYVFTRPAPTPVAPPAPNVRPWPKIPDIPPCPKCPDCPDCPRCPWRERAVGQVGEPEPMVDLLSIPSSGRPHNTGGKDGAGLCVFTSIQYAAWWQNEPRLRDFQAKMRQELGGGFPDKVDRMIAKYAPGVRYVQYQGKDPAVIELALKTGRVVSITWQSNHMLSCVHLDGERMGIVDNNAPERVQWYSRSEGLKRWTQGGGGWVVVLLNPPPPPAPRSRIPRPRVERTRCICPPSCPACRQDCGDGCRCLARSVQQWPVIVPQPQPIIIPAPPVVVPVQPGEEVARPRRRDQHGVVWSPPDAPRWELNGRASSWQEVAETLVDDSMRLHLTLIGPQAERARVLAELGGETSRYLVQEYEPGAWESQCGFVATGKPTVYLQARDGSVLLRQDAPQPGRLVGALRRADPGYNPASDPSGSPIPSGSAVVVWARDNVLLLLLLTGGVVAAAWYALGRPPAAAGQGEQAKASPARPEINLDAVYMEFGRREFERRVKDQMRAEIDPPAITPKGDPK